MLQIPLHALPWTVRAVGDCSRVPAELVDRLRAGIQATLHPEVGGCIHTDLMDAEGGGLIPDPAVGMNETLVEWVGWTDWCYECVFDIPGPGEPSPLDHHQIDLRFASLDTIATIELNGAEVGRTQSEFLPHRFNINAHLRPGRNTLRVTFTSPLRAAYDLAKEHGRPHNGDESAPPWHPFNMLRKCASNFGWDWGPRVPTCGITGPVEIEAWSVARFAPDWRCVTGVDDDDELAFDLRVERIRWSGPAELQIEVLWTDPDGERSRSVRELGADQDASWVTAFGNQPNWSPVGHGKPNLTPVTILLKSGDEVLDRILCRPAVRTASLNTERDPPNGFTLRINNRPIFCKGANWIPEGLWPRDRTRDKLRARLQQAKAAGMNMLRVWGGGRYETDAFYELCDELGIMVWQDFMFACALYPEEEPWRTLVEQEARSQVARLSRHPCVVLWCGGNENHWAYESWGFKQRLKENQTWGKDYWQDLLPKVVKELAPYTPYVSDSPWSPAPTHPNDAAVGDRHTWDVFGPDFRTVLPRFCSEFGVQSPSNLETLTAALTVPDASAPGLPVPPAVPEASAPGSSLLPPSLLARQRGPGGNTRWYDEFFAKAGIPAPTTFADWHASAQKLQADWLYLSLVWLRANWPTCAGALIWQLNDAWPGLSWSIIDSAGREKPSYHAVMRAFADRLVEVVPFGGVDYRVAINDTDQPWEVEPGWTVGARAVDKRPLSSPSSSRL